jgi:hypothetical protein
MRPLPLLLALALALAAPGCGAAPHEPSSPSLSAYSSGSSFSSPSSPSGPAVPQHGAVKADLVVRPDTLVLGFAIREVAADPENALASAQASVADLGRRLGQVTSGAATLKMCGTSISSFRSGKAADSEPAEAAVVVDGTVEVPLAPSLDYWARSRLLAGITRVTQDLTAAAKKAEDEGRGATFEQPRPVVKEPEAHRAELSARWIRRARAFAEAAQAAAAPLYLVDCAPPGEIEQRAISLEEIGLSLSVACRLDALPSGRGGARE